MARQEPRRLPVVGIMGSSREPHAELAEPLAAWLASQDVHLLTGGGGGVMACVSRAFYRQPHRRGLVIGIIPGQYTAAGYQPKPGYPNPWVEIPIFTHLPQTGVHGEDPLSRNHLNILSSRLIIALPGGAGTASEVALAVRCQRPVIAYCRHPGQLLPLPATVTVCHELAEVKSFVLEHLFHGKTVPCKTPW